MSEIVVTVTPTIQDGTVVRWYASLAAAEHHHDPIVSASRNGVRITTYLHLVPPAVLARANEAHEILRGGAPELVQDMATHRRKLGGRLLPILREDGGGPRP